jgi:hypothetical protein
MFCLLALVCHAASAVCQSGIWRYWGGNPVNVLLSAYADSGDLSGSQVLELRGSFVARITGEHEFKLWQSLYGGDDLFYAARTK